MAKDKRAKRGRPIQPDAEYRDLAQKLRQRILDGRWPPRTVLPSLRALAREYNVGQRVVRMAIEMLKSEDRLRTNAHRRLVVFRPGGAITTTEGMILEIMGGNMHTYLKPVDSRDLQCGIEFGAGDLWAPLLIMHDEHLRQALPEELLSYPLRGILLLGQLRNPVLRRYEKLNLPVVMVDRPGARWKLHAMAVENEAAACDATRRLIELGHRRIAFLRFLQLGLRDVDPDSKEREAGYVRACKEAGLPWKKDWVFNSLPLDTPASPSIQALFKGRPPFTAVIAVDPGRAELAIEAARGRGLTVPRDLSVVSFQSQKDGRNISGPATDFFELGRAAALLLQEPKAPPQHRRMPCVWKPGRTMSKAPGTTTSAGRRRS